MVLPTTWPLLALSLLVASAAAAQSPLPPRQRQERRAALPTTPAEPLPEVYVAVGSFTTVAFNGPLDRDSLVVDRTRFKWVDVGDQTLTLEPIADLSPGERLILQVGFKDRALPSKAVLAVLAKIEGLDAVYGRYTEMLLPDGRRVPVCYQLGNTGYMVKRPGSKPGEPRLDRITIARPARRWP